MMSITPIPRTPGWVLGVINLRGKVIPVVDLRLKFSMEPRPFDERTCIVVVEVSAGDGVLAIGLVVDGVNEVANIKEEEVEATPDFGTQLDTHYIQGMAKTGEQVRIFLDINQVLGNDDLSVISDVA